MENKEQGHFKQTKDAREATEGVWQRAADAVEQATSEEEVDQILDAFKVQVKQLKMAQDSGRAG